MYFLYLQESVQKTDNNLSKIKIINSLVKKTLSTGKMYLNLIKSLLQKTQKLHLQKLHL